MGSALPRGATYAIWSGTTGVTSPASGVPAVDVYTEQVGSDGCGVDFIPVGIFTDPSTSGALTIAHINGDWLQLTSATSATVYFNFVSDGFSEAAP